MGPSSVAATVGARGAAIGAGSGAAGAASSFVRAAAVAFLAAALAPPPLGVRHGAGGQSHAVSGTSGDDYYYDYYCDHDGGY